MEEATLGDKEEFQCQETSKREMVADKDRLSSKVTSQKTLLIVVWDLNGLLIMHSQMPLDNFPSIGVSHNTHTILRPKCIDFLKKVLERLNVGIWSIAKEENVDRIVIDLQK